METVCQLEKLPEKVVDVVEIYELRNRVNSITDL